MLQQHDSIEEVRQAELNKHYPYHPPKKHYIFKEPHGPVYHIQLDGQRICLYQRHKEA